MSAFAGEKGLTNSRNLSYQSVNARDVSSATPNFLFGKLVGQFQWKIGSPIVFRENGSMLNSWSNTSGNVASSNI